MNCDQAFDVMTDPDQFDSPVLSNHLDICPRCRQMYETLEPALGLFATAQESPELPVSADPDLSGTSSLQLARQVAVRLKSAHTARRETLPRRRQWSVLLVATAAGVLLALGISSLLPQPHSSPAGIAEECLWKQHGTVAGEQAARDVVVSCMVCHLAGPVQEDHAGIRIFSEELERIANRWQRHVVPPSPSAVLITGDLQKGLHHV